jgi:hypothetical protein
METPEFVFADHFAGRLTDPVLKRELAFTYRIHPMEYLAEGEMHATVINHTDRRQVL